MKSLIYRHTTFEKQRETSTLYVFGVSIFTTVTIDNDDVKHRPIGFTVFQSEALCHTEDDDNFDDDE
ncbi:MAG: hypothetical protein NC548_24300 [Lachnospiraceae bacterium]|nr:hypothetical protein [Lachnospiraceae bacterium]